MRHYRVGTRGSKLALWQAQHVVQALDDLHADARFELVTIHTTPDRRQDVPLQALGDKSLFVKEIEAALLDGSVDLAVHSLKDVPSRLDAPFALAAVLPRDDPRDVVLAADGRGLDGLPPGARTGTGSARREAQLRALRPDLAFAPLRGNVDTRVRKLREGEYQAVVLAAAGLLRLGIPVPAEAFLPPARCLPAPGQAAICIETLADKTELAALLAGVDHRPTRRAVEAERAFAAELDAGCRVPVAAYAMELPPGQPGALPDLTLSGLVASVDGRRLIRAEGQGRDPFELGQRVAREVLARGAAALLEPACR